MYIKQITIQGFKSYKAQTVVENISQRHNVVVGRNGSGKSNFFAAIRFVLGDDDFMRNKKKTEASAQLLHEGPGTAVMSAYVEILFDNSDHRFPTGGKEVRLRRTIGAKKDDYSIDGTAATRTDVMNMLESAGFSRSNPYYIVPQGRITSLTNAKDAERLNLLKEVAGTNVYEQKRRDSLRIMQETQAKRAQIEVSLDDINVRIGELQEERDVLRKYQDAERERRALEFAALQKELDEVTDNFERFEESRQGALDRIDAASEQVSQAQDDMDAAEQAAARLDEEIKRLQLDKDAASRDVDDYITAKANAELRLQELEEGLAQEAAGRGDAERELAAVEEQIAAKEAELAELRPHYEQVRGDADALAAKIDEMAARQHRLTLKQGRTFSSQAERDAWLTEAIAGLRETAASREQSLQALDSDVADLQGQLAALAESKMELQAQAEQGSSSETQRRLKQDETRAALNKDKLMDERKALWRDESGLEYRISRAKEDSERAESVLRERMPYNLLRGLRGVRDAVRSRPQLAAKVHGPLSELIECDDVYKLAVEVAAGNSMFHVVVEDDEVASQLIAEMRRKNLGSATFVPLNRVRNNGHHHHQQPPPDDSQYSMLTTKLRFDDAVRPAVEQVFGRFVLCATSEVAQQMSKAYGLTALTLSGEKVDPQGVMSGGYYDARKSRLDAVRAARDARREMEDAQEEARDVRDKIKRVEQQITQAINEVNKLAAARDQARQAADSAGAQVQQLLLREEQLRDLVATKQRQAADTRADLRALNEELASHEADLARPMTSALAPDEAAELESIAASLPSLKREARDAANRAVGLEEQLATLQTTLDRELLARKSHLRAKLAQLDDAGDRAEIAAQLRAQIADQTRQIDATQRQLADLDAQADAKAAELESTRASIAELAAQRDAATRQLMNLQKKAEKSIWDRSILLGRKQELQAKMKKHGVVAEEAFGEYMALDMQQIAARIKSLKTELDKYAHVNKKAAEQYQQFTKQRSALVERHVELVKSEESIDELIQTLDERKDEAITRTFRQVSKAFQEIFKRLVPAGAGRLVLLRKTDSDPDPAAEPDYTEESAGPSDAQAGPHHGRSKRRKRNPDSIDIENLLGVSIKVSFNSEQDEQLRIEQLSGGQKSLCALTLIFAIQQSDPAPFYLFDEIDANLDTQYRTAVADMIHALADRAQFVCTTFRPEMLQVADGFYGVFFKDKMSSVMPISREQAMGFVDMSQKR